MSAITLEQALYASRDQAGYRFLAQSPSFRDDWLPEAQRLCAAFGERPAGIACPECLFVQPIAKGHVAVVRVADQGVDAAGRPGAMAFHFLVLSRANYATIGGDPFLIGERFAPPWSARELLPSLVWPEEPIPGRTVAEVQRVLKRTEGPSLLGGAQVLIDGGRVRFERPGPDADLLRDLWLLLPTSTRCGLWPASFACGTDLLLHAVVVPPGVGPEEGYLNEEQAADYPEGRYELNLQIAAEAGDQRELDALFARRSRSETWRLGLALLCFLTVVVLIANWGNWRPAPVPPAAARAPDKLDLPADHYPRLTEAERSRLSEALRSFAGQAKLELLPAEAAPEALLTALDARLGPGEKGREPGADLTTGPIQRRLRALLWKHGVAEYRDPALNAVELVERLQRKYLDRRKEQR